MRMTNEELRSLTKMVAKNSFNLDFKDVVRFNYRLKTTGGRFIPHYNRIEMNPLAAEYLSKNEFIKILKHELCHYYLYNAGLNANHNSKAFKSLLASVGGSRFTPIMPQVEKYQYICQKCQHVYHRSRRIDVNKFRCGQCNGELTLVNNQKKAS